MGEAHYDTWVGYWTIYSSFYVYSCMGIILALYKDEFPEDMEKHESLVWLLTSFVFVGALLGQQGIGVLADRYGRRISLVIALSLLAIGSILSAFTPYGSLKARIIILAFCRLVSGFGAGGAAIASVVHTAELDYDNVNTLPRRLGKMNFMAYIGTISPYIIATICWFSTGKLFEFTHRIVLLFGGIPVLFCLPVVLLKINDTKTFKDNQSFEKLKLALHTSNNWMKVIGVGGSLFIYCFLCWGVLTTQPIISKLIFDTDKRFETILWQSIVLILLQAPGILLTLLLLPHVPCKWLLTYGLILFVIAATSLGLAAKFEANDIVQFMLLGFLNFALVWGSVGTILILPVITFPPECRGTFYGICAGMGKIGAMIGIPVCGVVLAKNGIPGIMILLSIVAIIGIPITLLFLPKTTSNASSNLNDAFLSLITCISFISYIKNPHGLAEPTKDSQRNPDFFLTKVEGALTPCTVTHARTDRCDELSIVPVHSNNN